MTLDAAVGSPDKAIDNLRAMLAASTTFQTWVGAADATEAAEHVHLDGVEPANPNEPFTEEELASLLPFVVVFEGESTHEQEAYGADVWRGTIVVEFTAAVQDEETPAEVNRRINNLAAGVVNDLIGMRGADGCLADFRITRVGSPWRETDEQLAVKGDVVHRVLHVRWAGM